MTGRWGVSGSVGGVQRATAHLRRRVLALRALKVSPRPEDGFGGGINACHSCHLAEPVAVTPRVEDGAHAARLRVGGVRQREVVVDVAGGAADEVGVARHTAARLAPVRARRDARGCVTGKPPRTVAVVAPQEVLEHAVVVVWQRHRRHIGRRDVDAGGDVVGSRSAAGRRRHPSHGEEVGLGVGVGPARPRRPLRRHAAVWRVQQRQHRRVEVDGRQCRTADIGHVHVHAGAAQARRVVVLYHRHPHAIRAQPARVVVLDGPRRVMPPAAARAGRWRGRSQ